MNFLDRFGTAQLLFDRQCHAEAATALAEVLSALPGFAPAHALLALCQFALKQDLLAKHHAEKAVELDPTNARNHFILSQVLIRFFDWEIVSIYARDGHRLYKKAIASIASMKALQSIEEAIRLDPQCAEFYAHRACIKLMFGKWGEALATANQGLEQDPQSIACLHYRASAWFEMEETDKADEATKCLLALDPNCPHGHAGLGDLALYQRRGKEAEQHYREALRLDPMLLWAERGLDAVRQMEAGRTMVREMAAVPADPIFSDPFAPVRWVHAAGKIIIVAFIALVVAQLVTAMLWPKNSLFDMAIRFLTQL
jgi:tetratricopeptide (TPR) repeat protein